MSNQAKGNFPTKSKRKLQIEKEFDTFNQLDNLTIRGHWLGVHKRIEVRCWNSNANCTFIRVKVHMILLNGDIVNHILELPVTSNRLENNDQFDLGLGWILSMMAYEDPAASKRGQTFVIVDLYDIREQFHEYHFLSNYIAEPFHPSWPGTPLIHPSEGAGYVHLISITDPDPLAEFTITVPVNAKGHVISIFGILTTSALVANRSAGIQFTDGTNLFYRAYHSGNITANSVARVSFGNGAIQSQLLQSTFTGNIPQYLILLAGYVLTSITFTGQVGDDWSLPSVYVEEWIDI